MKKIALVIPYIGKFRPDFSIFLHSCRNNPTVDFLFFCDNFDSCYFDMCVGGGNIHVIPTTLDKLKNRAQVLFPDLPISLNTPYKLCDYKPLYGLMFAKELEDYDYWGHCDTDIVLGDIRKFVNGPISEGKLKIQLHGHFSLYHNDDYTNNVFKEHHFESYNGFPGIVPYEDVLSSPKSFAFDEGKGVGLTWLRYHKEDFYCNFDIFSNPNRFIKSFSSQGEGLLNTSRRYYEYDNGTLKEHFLGKEGVDRIKELLYVHFYQRVIDTTSEHIDWNHFIIIPNRAIPYRNMTSIERWLNCYKPLNIQFWMKKIKSKLWTMFISPSKSRRS